MAHSFKTSTPEAEVGDLSEFKASLVYIQRCQASQNYGETLPQNQKQQNKNPPPSKNKTKQKALTAVRLVLEF